MWLADKMYIAYSVGCMLVAVFYVPPTNWGLLGSLALLWFITTIIYAEYRNG